MNTERKVLQNRISYRKNKDKYNSYRREISKSSPEIRIYRGLQTAKGRAKRKGIEFDIILEDLFPLPTHCPVLNFPLDYTVSGKASYNSPSIDRIDSTQGYIKGNVMIISYKANTIKNNATPLELRTIADFYERILKK